MSLAQCAQLTLTPDFVWDRDFGSGCASRVAMMHPADHRESDDLPLIGGLARAEVGGVLAEREVDPGSVMVNDCALDGVLRRDKEQLTFDYHRKRGLWFQSRTRFEQRFSNVGSGTAHRFREMVRLNYRPKESVPVGIAFWGSASS